ncbi:hypothetical protein D9M68_785080 [compost metagenome]
MLANRLADPLHAAGAGVLRRAAEIARPEQAPSLPGRQDRHAVVAVKALIRRQVRAAPAGKTGALGEQVPGEGWISGKGLVEQIECLCILRRGQRRKQRGIHSQASTFNSTPSWPMTLTERPAGRSGPLTSHSESPALILPRPLLMAS